ncbi:hypothetical protein GN956_G9017 [Arapaima gigas]
MTVSPMGDALGGSRRSGCSGNIWLMLQLFSGGMLRKRPKTFPLCCHFLYGQRSLGVVIPFRKYTPRRSPPLAVCPREVWTAWKEPPDTCALGVRVVLISDGNARQQEAHTLTVKTCRTREKGSSWDSAVWRPGGQENTTHWTNRGSVRPGIDDQKPS